MRLVLVFIVVVLILLPILTLLGLGIRYDSNPAPAADIVVTENLDIKLPDTDRYAAALRAYVDDRGMVDYAELQANPGDLNAYLTSIANLDPSEFEKWTDADRIAFWCNVYNAYTLKVIIANYPIDASFLRGFAYPKNSIRQISGVWNRLQWPVMGDRITLNTIEHEILRVEFDEPRIHAALVCAAKSCPPLRNEPYAGDRLEEQLEDQMRRFLLTPQGFRIDREEDVVYLSPIFEWYVQDFVSKYGPPVYTTGTWRDRVALVNAIEPHVSEDDAEYLSAGDFEIEYLKYDWTLNEQ